MLEFDFINSLELEWNWNIFKREVESSDYQSKRSVSESQRGEEFLSAFKKYIYTYTKSSKKA